MAKKRIRKEDIAPKDLFDNIIQGAKTSKQTIDMLKKSVEALNQVAQKTKSGLGGMKINDTKSMKDFDDLTRRANQTAKAKLNIDRQLLTEKAKLQQKQRELNKEIKEEVQATSKLTKEQQKNLGTLQKIQIENGKLRSERARLNLETKKGQQRLKEINAQLDKNNAKIKASGDAMKQQRMNVGNYAGAVNKLRNALGQLGIAFGAFQLIKDSFNVIKDFDQAQANLASVLGVSRVEMQRLTDQAKELGATTRFTASQVSELQMEFAKLGFTQSQIEGMTGSVLNLAGATGAELGESASVVGATMRGFGLEVGSTQRVTDVMSKSFSSSSLDMQKFSTAMASVAPVANLAGKSIEETTALIGTLTDRGIDASTAGTGLRNMFLQANKHGLDFDQALEKIKNSTDQTGTAMELFGTRGATLGVVLANNQQAVGELTEKLKDSAGATAVMAEMQLNTLGGSLDLLRSAWEGYILKMDEVGGMKEKLQKAVKWLAENLETIISVITTAIEVWVHYKAITIITAQANKFLAGSFMSIVKSQGLVKGAINGIKGAFQKFNNALKANIIGIVVVALYKLYEGLTVVETAQSKLADVNDRLEESRANAQVQMEKEKAELGLLVERIKDANDNNEERNRLIQELNDKYGTNLQNLEDETKFLKELDKVQKEINKNIENKIALMEAEQEFAIISEQIIRTELEQTKLRQAMADAWGQNVFTEFLQGFVDYENTKGVLKDQFNENKKFLNELEAQKKVAKANLKDLLAQQAKAEAERNKGKGKPTPDIPDEDDSSKSAKKLVDLRRKIEAEKIKQIEDDEERERKARENKLKNDVEDIRKTYAIKSQRVELIKELEETAQMELQEIRDKYAKMRQDAELKAEEEITKAMILEKQVQISQAEILSDEQLTLLEELDEILIIQAKQKANALLLNEEVTSEEMERIIAERGKTIADIEKTQGERRLEWRKAQYEKGVKEFEDAEKEKYLALLKSNKDQEKVDNAMLEFQIKQIDERIKWLKKKYPEMTDEILALEIQQQEAIRSLNEKKAKDDEKERKEELERYEKAITFASDLLTQEIDKRIAKIDEEIEKHRERANELEQLAINGNILAKESLAEERRLIAEAEAEKEKQERRKQQILLVTSVLQAYVANLEAGQESTEAFANAVVSKAVLDQFVASLGTFYDGTEDTGRVSNGLDVNGGRLAVLHNNERVMTARQNKKIGDYTNDEVANIMEQKRLGKLMDSTQIGVGWDNHLLVEELVNVQNKLDQVNKTIANKPELDVKVGEISSTAMKIVENRKKGGTRTTNTFIVRAK
jgi:hypothetical protein